MADWYEASGYPGSRRFGDSNGARAEFAAIAAAFAKLPALTGNAKRLSAVNAAGNAQAVVDLYFDDVGKRLGIGIAAPVHNLHINTPTAEAKLEPSVATNNALWRAKNTGGDAFLGLDSGTGSGLTGEPYALALWRTGNYPMIFGVGGAERMRINTQEQVLIGANSVFPGAAARLTVRFTGGGTEYGIAVKPTTDGTISLAALNAAGTFIGGVQQSASGITLRSEGALDLAAGGTSVWARLTTDGGFAMAATSAAPAIIAGRGILYVAADNSLRYRKPDGTVTILA